MDLAALVRLYLAGVIDIATFASRFSETGPEISRSGDAALIRLRREVDELFRLGYDGGLPIEDFRLGLARLVGSQQVR